jgi:hypothetical protein
LPRVRGNAADRLAGDAAERLFGAFDVEQDLLNCAPPGWAYNLSAAHSTNQ